jgi:hypothetical protein
VNLRCGIQCLTKRRSSPKVAQRRRPQGDAVFWGHEDAVVADDEANLRRGADRAEITAAVERILRAHIDDRVPVQLGALESAAQIPANRWRDNNLVTELAAIEVAKAERRAAGQWVGLLLASLAIACGFLGWRWRKLAAERSKNLPA